MTQAAGKRRPDVVIVGAGSAGCVLAERLSRDPNRSVLLLERGPATWPTAADRDLRTLPIDSGAPFAVGYREVSGLPVVRGCGLGGSATVNGGYFLRWHADDFRGWPTQWQLADIERAYAELDGPDGTMNVSAFTADELSEAARRFESYWSGTSSVRNPDSPWPVVGLNRVRANRLRGMRTTAAEAYLRPALSRSNVELWTGSEVEALVVSGAAVTGVRTTEGAVGAGEVILCAGTFGSAAILARSEVGATLDSSMAVREHRELLVHYRCRDAGAPTALLQTVLHTDDDLEIRCYSDDMARFISGMTSHGLAVGVAAMRPGTVGEVRVRDGDVLINLGEVAAAERDRLRRGADRVVEMLHSADFAGFVEPGSVAIDPVIGTSQHAWGSMPMGSRTDASGAVADVAGLRIVDGSILPTAGRSGPHATIMMMACRIGDALMPESADR